MANHSGQGKPVEPGIISRLVQGVRYAVTGKQDFFGPMQPMASVAQEEAKGRQFDYQAGQNLQIAPRSSERVGFPELRQLADAYDLMRLVIETRKDQISRMAWTVKPIDDEAEVDARCESLAAFLRFPNLEDDWATWLRQIMEDHLVLDAVAIYPRMTKGGDVYSLDLIDAATIKRVISVEGRTPMAPDPAYQQVIKGIPAVDYTADELIYGVRNKRTDRIYGQSPVEQVMMTVNIALRRQLHQLQYYTEGNIPEALISVPTEWTPDQVGQFQIYWDSLLEGDTAARRHAKFVPGGMNIVQTREDSLKDAYDEWLARIICFAFSISPHAFVKEQNRSTAQTQQATAKEEGLEPLMKWVESLMNRIIQRVLGYKDLCFSFQEEVSEDPLVQAQINQIYIATGVKTPNEVRAELGLDPLDDESMDSTGPMKATQIAEQAAAAGAQPGGEPGSQDPKDPNAEEEGSKDPKADANKFDVHIHLPPQPAPIVKFEPIIDVASPTVYAMVNTGEGDMKEAAVKMSKRAKS